MAFIHASVVSAKCAQSADNHESMLVTVKLSRRTDDTKVDISSIVEYGATSGAAADKRNRTMLPVAGGRGIVSNAGEEGQIDLKPRILIAPNDDRRTISVQEEDSRVGRRACE
jgi:hypothetical protein